MISMSVPSIWELTTVLGLMFSCPCHSALNPSQLSSAQRLPSPPPNSLFFVAEHKRQHPPGCCHTRCASLSQSLQNKSYNHFAAIYYLLVERLKSHRSSFPVEQRVDARQRRPSTVAEQTVAKVRLPAALPALLSLVLLQNPSVPPAAPRCLLWFHPEAQNEADSGFGCSGDLRF